MIRIQAISDIHGQLPPPASCPECDLLIIAGDICPDSRPIELQGTWLQREMKPWLYEVKAKTIVATWGNHDFIGLPRWSHLVPDGLPWHLGIDTEVTVEGLKMYLYPHVPNLHRWAFGYPGDVPAGLAARIPSGLDILVSHGPPRGYFDGAIDMKFGQLLNSSTHCGSETLLAACREKKPKVVICGHIHEGRGAKVPDWGGMIYNVASLDRMYRPYPERFTEITLGEMPS